MKCCKNMFCVVLMLMVINDKGKAQSFELQQLLLDIEKLSQLKNIYKDVVKGYEILTEGYNAVRDITQDNFQLHNLFLDSLLKVSSAVSKYYKVSEIIDCEVKIMNEYKIAFKRFKSDKNFSTYELQYIDRVYGNLSDESLKGLNDLMVVITDNQIRASDDERIKNIDRICDDMKERLSFLRYFNNSTTVLALQRAREINDIHTIKNIYGIIH